MSEPRIESDATRKPLPSPVKGEGTSSTFNTSQPLWTWTTYPSHHTMQSRANAPLSSSSSYQVTFALSRIDGPLFIPESSDFNDFVNDSNAIVSPELPLEPDPESTMILVSWDRDAFGYVNRQQRLGAISIDVHNAKSAADAYERGRRTFNNVHANLILHEGLLLRSDATHIANYQTREVTVRQTQGSTDERLMEALDPDLPDSLQALVLAYADGATARSPYYRFLRYYAISEVLTTTIQGAFKALSLTHGVLTDPMNGVLPPDGTIGNKRLANVSFVRILRIYRPLRIRIAHIVSSLGRIPDVEALEFPLHVLREQTLALLRTMRHNCGALYAAGLSQDTVESAIFEATNRSRN